MNRPEITGFAIEGSRAFHGFTNIGFRKDVQQPSDLFGPAVLQDSLDHEPGMPMQVELFGIDIPEQFPGQSQQHFRQVHQHHLTIGCSTQVCVPGF